MKIAIWHNIMWARYKAAVFSALHSLCAKQGAQLKVYQIAETSSQRTGLSPTDMSWHRYPYTLLFRGAYENITRASLFWKVAREAWADDADITILAGYDRPEYWIQAIVLLFRRKTFACFCDSTAYDNPQRFLAGLLKRAFFAKTSGIFCYGQRAAEYVRLYGAAPQQIIHRCQAAALYEGYSPQLALEKRLAISMQRHTPRFVYVGRFSPEKSLDHLFLAFLRLLKVLPNAQLALVGGGPEEQHLRALCTRLGIQESVLFVGPKHDSALFSEYLGATALVLPSYSEPWGLVVNEALSHGCPVVVSDRCGCVPELVVEGKTGFSFPWGDIELLAQAMRATTEMRIETVASACLQQISSYTPENAAQSIFDGCVILSAAQH